MTAVIDPFILERAPGPLVELDPALVRARAAFRATLDALARLEDDALVYAWTWEGNPVDVRYAFYRVVEILEPATAAAHRALAASPTTEARDAVAAATVSRWALQGVLATLTDADLDADPSNDEWTIRRTMGHINGSQRGYAWGSAWWMSVRDEPRQPGAQRAPDELFASMPPDEREADGSLADVRRQLDDLVDTTSSRYATLTTDEMNIKSGWSGYAVTIGFRQWRWSSHMAEHTIQIEKTIDMLGRRRSEVDWLTRLIAVAYGRLESTVFGRGSAGASASGAVFDDVARQLDELLPSVLAAVAAAVPAEEW
jgi:hypothetical protein